MAQRFYNDKIVSLTHSSGILTLAAGSILTIGGQQYTLSSNVTASLPSLAASTLYMVYAIVSNGVVSIVSSTNFNSTGPAGASAWKLVGAYVSTVTSTFGDVLTIDAPVVMKLSAQSAGNVTINTGVSGFVDNSSAGADRYGITRVPSGAYNSATGQYATANPRWVNPIPGATVQIEASVAWTTNNANFANSWSIIIRKNGSTTFSSGRNGWGSNTAGSLSFMHVDQSGVHENCVAGDYFEVLALQDLTNLPTAMRKSFVIITAVKAFKDM